MRRITALFLVITMTLSLCACGSMARAVFDRTLERARGNTQPSPAQSGTAGTNNGPGADSTNGSAGTDGPRAADTNSGAGTGVPGAVGTNDGAGTDDPGADTEHGTVAGPGAGTSAALGADQEDTTAALSVLPDQLDGDAVLSPTAYERFDRYLDTLQVSYGFYGLVDVEEALARYEAVRLPKETGSRFIRDGVVDTQALRTQVLENNAAFLATASVGRYGPLPQKEFDLAFAGIVQALEYCLAAGTDPGPLDAKLAELELVEMKSPGFGSTDFLTYGIGINMASTKDGMGSLKLSHEDLVTMTAMHEGNHLCQYHTPREREEGSFAYGSGMCYEWEDLETCPMIWKWYYEGAAEQLAMAESGRTAPNTYETYIRVIDCLTSAILPRPDSAPDSLARLSLQPKLEPFLNALGAKEGEAAEIVQMMYGLDLYLTQKPEFGQAYKAAYGQAVPDGMMTYGETQMAAAAQTMTKLFYRNLAAFLQEEEGVSFLELFSLLCEFEVEMSTLTRYRSQPELKKDFFLRYQEVQAIFFDCLSAETGVDADTIAAGFAAFYASDASDVLYLPHLSAEKQAFLQKIMGQWGTNKKEAICREP